MEERARDFVLEVFADIKSAWGGRIKTRDEKRRELGQKRAVSKLFDKGREPKKLEIVLQKLTVENGWQQHFAETEIMLRWEQIAGSQIAAKTKIVGIENGVLQIQAFSHNWLGALRVNRQQLFEKITAEFPAAKVQGLEFLPPGTLSWKHGKYAIKGRGPRDTYDAR